MFWYPSSLTHSKLIIVHRSCTPQDLKGFIWWWMSSILSSTWLCCWRYQRVSAAFSCPWSALHCRLSHLFWHVADWKMLGQGDCVNNEWMCLFSKRVIRCFNPSHLSSLLFPSSFFLPPLCHIGSDSSEQMSPKGGYI